MFKPFALAGSLLAMVPAVAVAETLPPRDEVLGIIKREASAEVARLKTLDAHPETPRDNVTGLTTNWVSATFLIGATRLTQATDVSDVREYVVRAAMKFNYALAGAETPVGLINADNQALGDVYESLYERSGQAGILMPLQQRLDYTLPYLTKTPQPKRLVWWWCDALYMAPAVYVRMSNLTGDPKYIQAMDAQWWRTYDRLWDADEHLYARDERFITRRATRRSSCPCRRGGG